MFITRNKVRIQLTIKRPSLIISYVSFPYTTYNSCSITHINAPKIPRTEETRTLVLYLLTHRPSKIADP